MAKVELNDKVAEFVRDAAEVLERHDERVYMNVLKSQHQDFYSEDWKGLGIGGVTEPIVRFLITSELCRKYRIWPEWQYRNGSKQRADIALFFGPPADKEGYWEPDAIIEMKWANFRRRDEPGSFNNWAIGALQGDLEKLRYTGTDGGKYVLQVAFVPEEVPVDLVSLGTQVNDEVSGNLTRWWEISLVEHAGFATHAGGNGKPDHRCLLLCWQLEKR